MHRLSPSEYQRSRQNGELGLTRLAGNLGFSLQISGTTINSNHAAASHKCFINLIIAKPGSHETVASVKRAKDPDEAELAVFKLLLDPARLSRA